jgi:[protein-PII] uridylyltransferase
MQTSCEVSPVSSGIGSLRRAVAQPPALPSLRSGAFSGPREATFSFAPCHDSLAPAQLLAALKRVLRAGRDSIRADFDLTGDGIGAARQHSALMDALIRRLLILAGGHSTPGIAVAAVGGHGRAELAPGSDLDLLFLTSGQPDADTAERIAFVLYRLWDLGLPVGHAVRSIDDCIDVARADWRTAVSLLDLRFLCGRRTLYDAAAGRIATEIAATADDLSDGLLAGLARRHARFRDPGVPDVKHGPGGLRDLQTLRWLARLSRPDQPDRLRIFGPPVGFAWSDTARFLWSVRTHLHYLTGRAEDRLSEDLRPHVARGVLWDDRPARRSAPRLMARFQDATGPLAQWSTRFACQ